MKKILFFILLMALALYGVSALHSTAGPPEAMPLLGPVFSQATERVDLVIAAPDAAIGQSQVIGKPLISALAVLPDPYTTIPAVPKIATLAGLIWGIIAALLTLAEKSLRFQLRDRFQAMPRDQSTAWPPAKMIS